MSESKKAVLGLIVGVCLFVSIIAWAMAFVEQATATVWWLRIGCPVVGGICLAVYQWAQKRKAKVPDFLSRITPRYFERDGFCFAAIPQVRNGQCDMHITSRFS